MKLLPYDPLIIGSYLLSCGQMWVEPQHGGCLSMAGDGMSGWRVENM